jgi:hypothetical protein
MIELAESSAAQQTQSVGVPERPPCDPLYLVSLLAYSGRRGWNEC